MWPLGEHMIHIRLPAVSFGAVSALVTSVGLIIGFGAAGIPKITTIAGLLILGLADNLTDSLSIHVYQESERLEQHVALKSTIGNFMTRFALATSFIAIVAACSDVTIMFVSLAWGTLLLTGLTWLLAKSRGVNIKVEIFKHLAVASVVIAISRIIGMTVSNYM